MAQEVYSDIISLGCVNSQERVDKTDLLGKVVIIFSFRETNVLSLAYMTKIREWGAHYHKHIQLIGLYSPHFPQEKREDRLNSFLRMHQIDFPVFADNDGLFRKIYGLKNEPAVVLFDQLGRRRSIGVGNIDLSAVHDMAKALLNQGIEAKLNRTTNTLLLEKPTRDETFFNSPTKAVYIESLKQIAVSDTGNHRVVLLDCAANIQDIIGGTEPGDVEGDYASARLRSPRGLAVVGDALYVADSGNHKIKKIDLVSKKVAESVGSGILNFHQKVAHRPNRLSLAYPVDVSYSPLDNSLLISNTGSRQILKFLLDKNEVYSLMGNGRDRLVDDIYTMASFVQPASINSQFPGMLCILDNENSSLRLASETEVKTVWSPELNSETQGSGESLVFPEAMCFDGKSGLLITDSEAGKLLHYDIVKKELSRLLDSESGLKMPDGICRIADGEFIIVDKLSASLFHFSLDTKTLKTLKPEFKNEQALGGNKAVVLPPMGKSTKESLEHRSSLDSVSLELDLSKIEGRGVELKIYENHQTSWLEIRRIKITNQDPVLLVDLNNVSASQHFVFDLIVKDKKSQGQPLDQLYVGFRLHLKHKPDTGQKPIRWKPGIV